MEAPAPAEEAAQQAFAPTQARWLKARLFLLWPRLWRSEGHRCDAAIAGWDAHSGGSRQAACAGGGWGRRSRTAGAEMLLRLNQPTPGYPTRSVLLAAALGLLQILWLGWLLALVWLRSTCAVRLAVNFPPTEISLDVAGFEDVNYCLRLCKPL